MKPRTSFLVSWSVRMSIEIRFLVKILSKETVQTFSMYVKRSVWNDGLNDQREKCGPRNGSSDSPLPVSPDRKAYKSGADIRLSWDSLKSSLGPQPVFWMHSDCQFLISRGLELFSFVAQSFSFEYDTAKLHKLQSQTYLNWLTLYQRMKT